MGSSSRKRKESHVKQEASRLCLYTHLCSYSNIYICLIEAGTISPSLSWSNTALHVTPSVLNRELRQGHRDWKAARTWWRRGEQMWCYDWSNSFYSSLAQMLIAVDLSSVQLGEPTRHHQLFLYFRVTNCTMIKCFLDRIACIISIKYEDWLNCFIFAV